MEPDGSIETSPGLEREGRALLGAMATVATAIALSGVVVSLFFFTRGRGPLTLTLQFLGTYVGMPIGSAVAGRLWRWGPTPLVRLSLFLFAA